MNFQAPVSQVHNFIFNGLKYRDLRKMTEKQEKLLSINLVSKFTSMFIFGGGGEWDLPDKCGN
jgi:hypothetical protein